VVVLFLPDGLMGLLPKQFKLADQTALVPASSSTTSGFVQSRVFDWFTPLQQALRFVGRIGSKATRTLVDTPARASKRRSKSK